MVGDKKSPILTKVYGFSFFELYLESQQVLLKCDSLEVFKVVSVHWLNGQILVRG